MREVKIACKSWEMKSPFRITGHVFTKAHLLEVCISENGYSGRGEAAGVYYLDETPDSMSIQIEAVRTALEQGADRHELLNLLPRGGARNAVDCALWDLEAKRNKKTIWQLTNISPDSVTSVNTVGIGTVREMARAAEAIESTEIKIKLDGEMPVERVAAVIAARPDAGILVDVNQGWTFSQLVEFAPKLKALGVAMIEQPLARGADEELEGYQPPLPICADESCLDTSEFEQAARRYQMINIKLDKTGGLTEALALASLAKSRGVGLMVGNMVGSSLAMAPGFVIAQLCRFVDLDGALFLKQDRQHPMTFAKGVVSAPSPQLWG